jgi:hypothetical protein
MGGKVWRVASAGETRRQIDALISSVRVSVINVDDTGERVGWEFFHEAFDSLVAYRETQATGPMADRPPIMVVATDMCDGVETVVHIDWYSGHDFLRRKKLLHGKTDEYVMPDFSDDVDYGLRLPGFGMTQWYAGSFQTTIIQKKKGRKVKHYDTDAMAMNHLKNLFTMFKSL